MHARNIVLSMATILVVAGVSIVAPAVAQDNGILSSPGAGPAASGPIAIDDPLWYEFAFSDAGTPATGCAPADPAGPGCGSSSGANSQFADAPPWTFDAAGPVVLTVVDAFLVGDVFEVFDGGSSIGTTSAAPASGSCGSDPVDCLADPNASSGTFALGAGSHSITIVPTSSPFGSGAAYFRVESSGAAPSLPVAAALVLVALLLAAGAWQVRRRRAI